MEKISPQQTGSVIEYRLQKVFGKLDCRAKAEDELDRIRDELRALEYHVETFMGWSYENNIPEE